MSKSIIIDPGHGGTDNGASGFGIREKDWALRISLYQYRRLKELGAEVGITRTDDRSLSSVPRTNLIKGKYDYAISNHWNAFNGKARGIETIHSIYGGKTFATRLADALVKATGLPLRRVFDRRGKRGDYYFMHRMTGSTTTVIIEHGFIDNKLDNDWYKDQDNFTKAAEAVIEAVCKQIGVKYVAPDGTSTPNVNKPKPSKPASKTIEQLADEVIAGKHGTGKARKKALGSNYKAVQNLVNKKLGAKPASKPSKSIEQLAREVIDGKHGSGEARKKALGSQYNAVQKRVNEILGAKSTKTTNKTRSVKVGDTVTAKALYANSGSTKNVRSSSIKGYVDTINNNWRNPIRLRNKKGGHYIGFTRKQDLV